MTLGNRLHNSFQYARILFTKMGNFAVSVLPWLGSLVFAHASFSVSGTVLKKSSVIRLTASNVVSLASSNSFPYPAAPGRKGVFAVDQCVSDRAGWCYDSSRRSRGCVCMCSSTSRGCECMYLVEISSESPSLLPPPHGSSKNKGIEKWVGILTLAMI